MLLSSEARLATAMTLLEPGQPSWKKSRRRTVLRLVRPKLKAAFRGDKFRTDLSDKGDGVARRASARRTDHRYLDREPPPRGRKGKTGSFRARLMGQLLVRHVCWPRRGTLPSWWSAAMDVTFMP